MLLALKELGLLLPYIIAAIWLGASIFDSTSNLSWKYRTTAIPSRTWITVNYNFKGLKVSSMKIICSERYEPWMPWHLSSFRFDYCELQLLLKIGVWSEIAAFLNLFVFREFHGHKTFSAATPNVTSSSVSLPVSISCWTTAGSTVERDDTATSEAADCSPGWRGLKKLGICCVVLPDSTSFSVFFSAKYVLLLVPRPLKLVLLLAARHRFSISYASLIITWISASVHPFSSSSSDSSLSGRKWKTFSSTLSSISASSERSTTAQGLKLEFIFERPPIWPFRILQANFFFGIFSDDSRRISFRRRCDGVMKSAANFKFHVKWVKSAVHLCCLFTLTLMIRSSWRYFRVRRIQWFLDTFFYIFL